jgi:hypothetical protein
MMKVSQMWVQAKEDTLATHSATGGRRRATAG